MARKALNLSVLRRDRDNTSIRPMTQMVGVKPRIV